MSTLSVDRYLDRINHRGSLTPTADTLRALHVAHLLSVPFENLSIQAGEQIVLDDVALFDKIVRRRRGGFCYELNGLFAWLLRSAGFEVTMLAAEVMNALGDYGLPFDHMTLLVTLEEDWLVDVGFGDSFLEPVRLAPQVVQTQHDRAYRIDATGEQLYLMQRVGSAAWRAQYRFTLQPHQYPDYAEMCRYHQTSPESPFTQRRVCSMAMMDGRVTLTDRRLITTRSSEREERELPSQQACADALRDYFGVVLTVS